MELTGTYFKDSETGNYTAICKEFPQVISQGRTRREAKKLLIELIKNIIDMKQYGKDNGPGGPTVHTPDNGPGGPKTSR